MSRISRKLYKLFHPAWGDVLMLHRIVQNRSQLAANRQMEITSEFLEQSILDYLAKGYRFVSLDEVYEIITKNKRQKQKFVCFTLDDGYVDNYELAYPIFKKYNCPFAIYVTTNFPDGKALLWWYILEDILLENNVLLLGDGSRYDCTTIEMKNAAFNAVREKIFNSQSQNMEATLNCLFENYNFSFVSKTKQLSLTWKQIQELSRDKLCTIASHTVSHAVLTTLNKQDLEHELIMSKNTIESYIGTKVNHFAYPYGIYNQKVMEIIKTSGYQSAVIVNGGKVRQEKSSPFEIKRLILSC